VRADLLDRVKAGEFPIGTCIPSVRALMREYAVSLNTAGRAVNDLVREGYLATRPGHGTIALRSTPPTEPERRLLSIGLLLCDADPIDAYYGHVVHSVQDACWRLTRTMSCLALDTSRGDEARAKVAHLARETCGLVVAGYATSTFIEMVAQSASPVVALGHPIDGGALPPTVDMAVADGRQAGFAAVEHLVRSGRRRIALVTQTLDYHWYHEIRRGYDEAAEQYGIVPQVHAFNDQKSGGEEVARRILEAQPSVDALVAANPGLFNGMAGELRERVDRCPGGIAAAVIGEFAAGAVQQFPVTRVTWDNGVFEKTAVRLLLERLEQPSRPAQVVCAPHQVVEL
jgi:DNA-binding LacI/PurR family transcriptional regulator